LGNWVPQHIDKPFKLFFDSEVWGVGLFFLTIFIIMGLNQAVSIGLMLILCWIIQKINDRHPRGFLIHWVNAYINTGLFEKKTKYRI